MKILLKSTAAALLALGTVGAGFSAPAMAQAVTGIGLVDQRAAVVKSSAFVNAAAARPTTYKAQYDAAQARSAQIRAQLEPLVNQFNAGAQQPNPDQAALQKQLVEIQTLRQQGSAEVEEILQPVALSEAYVLEQISDKFDEALRNAMNKRKITIVFDMSATLAHNGAYDMTNDVVTELNALVPNAQIVPPPGWKPRAQREAEARAAAAQAAQQPAGAQQPEGR